MRRLFRGRRFASRINPLRANTKAAWLPISGAEPAEAPIFEEYLNDPRSIPAAELITDIHLPIRAVPDGPG